MAAETSDQQRARVADARRDALRRLASAHDRLVGIRTAKAAEPGDDEHDPEGPTLAFEWSMTKGVIDDAQGQLEAADAALARIEAGTYGVCVTCGEPIAEGRLEARPLASECITCARAASQRRR